MEMTWGGGTPLHLFLEVRMSVMCAAVRRLVRLEDGQDLLEYGLLAVLISVFVLGALTSLSTVIKSVFWQPIVQNF